MTKLSRLRGSEGYAVRDDAGVRGDFLLASTKESLPAVDARRLTHPARGAILFG